MVKLDKNTRLLIIFIVFYILVLGSVSVLRHYQFQTQTWDMGAFVQTFWNTNQGRVMMNNLEEAPNHLGVHMSPWLLALVPGYFIFNSPYYLLIIQTLALALGAWPLFLLAKHYLNSDRFALLMAGGYLLYPSLHWVNLFDFHAVAFFIPLMLAAFYFLSIERWAWASVFLVLAAAAKENAILAVLFVGLYFLVAKKFIARPNTASSNNSEIGVEFRAIKSWWTKQRKIGLLTAVLALIYFIVSVKVIMPALGGGLLRLDRYTDLGTTLGAIIGTVFANPTVLIRTIFTVPKFFYILWTFLPLAFLPWLARWALLLFLPGLAQNLLTSFEFQFQGLYQYDAILIPMLWWAGVLGLAWLLVRKPQWAEKVWWVLLIAIIGSFLLRSPVKPIGFPVELFGTRPRWAAFRQMVQLVPEQASVAAHTNLVPHLSHRQHAYMLGQEPFMVDVVLLDTSDAFGFSNFDEFQSYVDGYVELEEYRVRVIEHDYAILTRPGLSNGR
jgi:uncharacterized membrane protein